MSSMINYLLEANIGLIFFYFIYCLLLRNENQFGFKRLYLLGSLAASLVFPMISIPNQGAQLIPSLSNSSAIRWLPEITIYGQTTPSSFSLTPSPIWYWIGTIYVIGFLIFLTLFLLRLTALVVLFRSSKKYYWKNYYVVESEKGQASFSFFHFIFIGQSDKLSDHEKESVLLHEEAHAEKFHSIDILFVNVMSILFWFNPVLHLFRNSMVQIHEFEADARSVDGRDMNAYCTLLAKEALRSNGYILANHFTNSLTLKRIQMMKSVRKKIKQWKVAATFFSTTLLFLIVACQDQVMQDIQTVADNSSAATLLPPNVETELTRLKEANPKSEYIVLEMNEEGKKKLEELDKNVEFNKNVISVSVIKGDDQSFVILEKGEKTNMLSQLTAKDGEIFTVVDDSAIPEGGFPKLYQYIAMNLTYPLEARKKGIEGKVFVEFIVNQDGTLSDIHAIKGIGADCDAEAVRVVKGSPQWNPAKQNGKIVRQRMVLPINFQLNNSEKKIETGQLNKPTMEEVVVVGNKPEKN